MTIRKKRGTIKVTEDGRLYVDESTLQAMCIKLFRLKYSKYSDLLFSIPNGARIGGRIGKKGFPILASILKAEGLTEGIPDLLFAFPTKRFPGLFIEMKTIIGTLSPEQRQKCELLSSVGYAVAKCDTLEDFDKTIGLYLSGEFAQVNFWEYKRTRKKIP